MSGNALKMSAAAELPINLDQVPPSSPRDAWAPTAQPVPHQRHFSNGSDHQHSPPMPMYHPWQYQDNPPPQYSPWQPQPSYHNDSGIHRSSSTSTPALPQQQTPPHYPASGYPAPYQSGQVQRGHRQATGMCLGL